MSERHRLCVVRFDGAQSYQRRDDEVGDRSDSARETGNDASLTRCEVEMGDERPAAELHSAEPETDDEHRQRTEPVHRAVTAERGQGHDHRRCYHCP